RKVALDDEKAALIPALPIDLLFGGGAFAAASIWQPLWGTRWNPTRPHFDFARWASLEWGSGRDSMNFLGAASYAFFDRDPGIQRRAASIALLRPAPSLQHQRPPH